MINYNELKELYRISSPSGREFKMVNYIDKKLRTLGATTYRDKFNNLYATKGDSLTYPCIVAHTDEVHNTKPKGFAVKQLGDMLIGFNTRTSVFSGIGADDKNGIWIALKCFEIFDDIKAAFFVSEEIGCVGSSGADMTFFYDCRFVIQCDRKGNSDFISEASGVELCSKDFVKDSNLKAFRYKEAKGAMTDVMELKYNNLKISACNISCGYYNPHTSEEYTNLKDLGNCLSLVCHIINNCTDVYPHEYKAKAYNWIAPNKYDSFDFWQKEDAKNDSYISYDWSKKYEMRSDDLFGNPPYDSLEYERIKAYIEREILRDGAIEPIRLFDDIIELYPMTDEADIEMAYEEVTGCPMFS